MLKKKWFVTDAEITEEDNVLLHMVYAQVNFILFYWIDWIYSIIINIFFWKKGVDSIRSGEHPLKEEEAIQCNIFKKIFERNLNLNYIFFKK